MTYEQVKKLEGLHGHILTKHGELYGPGVLTPGTTFDLQDNDVECLCVRDEHFVEVWVPVAEIEEIVLR